MKKLTLFVSVISVVIVLTAAGWFAYAYFLKGKMPFSERKFNKVVQSFDPKKEESFKAIEEIIKNNGTKAVPVVQKYTDNENLYARYISIYILSRVGDETVIPDLEKALDDKNPSLRNMAAGALARLGDKNTLPVLIEGLVSSELLLLSEPPKTISINSAIILEYYTGENFGYKIKMTDKEKEEVQIAWRKWWQENKDQIKWDKEKKKFTT